MVDKSIIEFIKNSFPGCASEIKVSLELLVGAIEMTIDKIEDESSKFIKKDRSFQKSNEYRSKSEQIYQIITIVQEYIESLDVESNSKSDTEYIENIDTIEQDEESKKVPNYSQYLVDPNIEHNLYEDYTYKRPASFELKGKGYKVKDWKDMLTQTADLLADIDKDIILTFPDNPKMNGKKVVYFSFKEDKSMRSPRKLKDVDIYIATNYSANQIRNIIINMLRQYKIPLTEYKVYLKADYTELH